MAKTRARTSEGARSFIQRHIKKHMEEGMERKRAIAAAYSEARRKGFRIPKRKKRKNRD